MSFNAGTKLSRYEIRSKLGVGEMGEVYLTEDTKLHIGTVNGVSNIWSLPLDGGKPVQLTDFKTFRSSRSTSRATASSSPSRAGTETSDVILIPDFQ
jgi:serine/threonine protein kinase